MEIKEPKSEYCTMWAYFAPDGNIQVRSIAQTRKLSRQMLCFREYDFQKEKHVTYKDYEQAGYRCHKVIFSIDLLIK